MSSKVQPEDQTRQAATKDLFQAVGSVLEGSLFFQGPEEPAEAKGSQVGVSAQRRMTCPHATQLPYAQLTPAFLDGSFSSSCR